MKKTSKLHFSAVKTALAITLLGHALPMPAWGAGLPVIDVASILQSVQNYYKLIDQYKKQIEQYKNEIKQYTMQGKQYANMLKNSRLPKKNIWNKIQRTIASLNQKNNLGGMQKYLDKSQDVTYYQKSPCFNDGNCTATDLDTLRKNQILLSSAQKQANDAQLRTLNQQQANLQSESKELSRLQSAAQGADGQLQSIGYANQFASAQTSQLMEMRSMMIAQQAAEAARWRAEADRRALQQAADDKFFQAGNFTHSQKHGWTTDGMVD